MAVQFHWLLSNSNVMWRGENVIPIHCPYMMQNLYAYVQSIPSVVLPLRHYDTSHFIFNSLPNNL